MLFIPPTNDDRATRALKALCTYSAEDAPAYSAESIETRVADLICDLLHLVRRDKGSDTRQPFDVLQRALMNFQAEENGE